MSWTSFAISWTRINCDSFSGFAQMDVAAVLHGMRTKQVPSATYAEDKDKAMPRKQICTISDRFTDGTRYMIITEHNDPCDGTGAFVDWDWKWILGEPALEDWEVGQILGGN